MEFADHSHAFRYDVVNLGREVLAQLTTSAALNFSDALSGDNLDPRRILNTGTHFQKILLDLDELLATE